ncbi:MAG: pyruvate:ferredoxin (flavodoxin) oxidoreductase [Clostridia bacterium]|nr:pyruvate:ferredoxin (flavodoxin) oxidoreductase [Clostridia bacterium]
MTEKKFATMDGNEAAAYMAYPFTEVAAIYPITPSSPMATLTDKWAAQGRLNMFGQTVTLTEMQSEAGAIGAVHGSIQTGALSTSYTSSQGLMLMIPVLYRIAGERQPAVLHVAARTVGTHAMSIFGDHSDVMACRETGWAQYCTGSVQEVADLAAVAHLAAIETNIPFMHFFDGFRTSHEINKIELPDEQAVIDMIDRDAVKAHKDRALNPEHPTLRNTVQNPDIYFQVREANNKDYDDLPEVVEKYFHQISELTGRKYELFNYYGDPDATDVIVAMGSVTGAIQQTVDVLRQQGRKVGFVQVHLYRPFSIKHLFKALPETTKRIAVLDRCKNMGSLGEPLYEDVCTAVLTEGKDIKVIGGRYGLSSKDTYPAQIVAVYDNMIADEPIEGFTIGIVDDVTFKSLSEKPFELLPNDVVSCKFWGLGGDGTVGANKSTVDIINSTTDNYGQAYFEYDAKKSLGTTKSHLRFSSKPIRSSYYVKDADFAACHNHHFINSYNIVEEIKPGGALLLDCPWTEEQLDKELSPKVKRLLAQKNIDMYIIDATKIAGEIGLGNHKNSILQSAFFTIREIIPKAQAITEMENAVRRKYRTKGNAVVKMNIRGIEAGVEGFQKVNIPSEWANCQDEPVVKDENLPWVIENFVTPINNQVGDSLPVSALERYKDGHIEMGLTAYEKRGLAVFNPEWDPDKCNQCNRCAFVCPHAAIRPFILNEIEKENAPEGFQTAPIRSYKPKYGEKLHYSLQISTYDCTGCGACVPMCPAKEPAIKMVPAEPKPQDKVNWNYALNLSGKGDVFPPFSIRGSQFRQPLVEFSAACAGCGETPYAKLLTQLFGDRIYWANGTGCSQAWGSGEPGIPYCLNKRGHGVAWTNSLFENNAELALGMYLSVKQQRERQRDLVLEYIQIAGSNSAAIEWMDTYDDLDKNRDATDLLVAEMEEVVAGDVKEETAMGQKFVKLTEEILERKDMLAKKSFWMYGGDGWAYDIGFGGLDHVIATGEDINVFIIDNEVYSNTGGQSSKATPLGAVAEFQASGKKSRKKDIGQILKTYGNVYVASVSMGYDFNQLLKAIKEAEAHKGPSVIVAYTPCTVHGIKKGMHTAQEEMKRAVESGYWPLYRYNPDIEEGPKMIVDCKEPSLDYEDFLSGENRYAALKITFPENAEKLFKEAAEDAKERYKRFKKQEEEN